MKKLMVFLLTVNLTGCASAQTQGESQAMGALVGGTLGYILGDGSGHQKEIAAGAAVAGALVGGATYDRRAPERNTGYQPQSAYDARDYCESQVPQVYRNNYGARESWIRGCAQREAQRQQEFENRAYHEGYRQ